MASPTRFSCRFFLVICRQVRLLGHCIKMVLVCKNIKMFSYFGRINYTLMDRYLFEANFRADASSRFYADNRWGYFPSFSMGWRISEEPFMKSMRSYYR